MNYVLIAIGIAILVFDGWLELSGRDTISRAYQRLLKTKWDWVVFGAGMVFVCWFMPDWIDKRVLAVYAAFFGHVVISNRERYGEKR